MADQGEQPRRPRLLGGARPTGEHHRATTFELFFDLVFVFAATRVTAFMAHEHSAHGVLQGLLLLAMLWWTWEAYTWLGNQARADEGVLRGGTAVATAAVFVVALAVPESWHDVPGGLFGPLVLVCAYLLVRVVHLTLYAIAAGGDAALRRQILLSWASLLAGAPFLVVGALLGGWAQTALFAGALLVDWIGTYVTSRQGNWRVHSAAHWSERHGLFVLLAIGESVAAIGVGAGAHGLSTPVLAAAVLGIGVAVCLWWLYFDTVALAAEHRLARTTGVARVKMVVEAYTYGHFPIVTGIIVTALGVEGVLAHAGDSTPLGGFYAPALFGGAALYLGGHVLFGNRLHATVKVPRLVTVAVLLVALPGAMAVPPLVALGGLVLVLAGLIAFETRQYAEQRRELRQ
ncbi:low temperature requirement protein A [Nonomuraea sp. PA05]|uniref:low temperature requirement protein A n=1 Tax=Nonomuraea sp. PA05 TaxID=2604466 RepID=UPI0011D7275D|nr:low temperature requirement protein A [Nonomuraea sp. PA05]TYB69087.1 low temperature requirement protein A [Nonomuraea sp. PA05]